MYRKFGEIWMWAFDIMRADRQTDKQTDIQTCCSQYFAPVPGRSNHRLDYLLSSVDVLRHFQTELVSPRVQFISLNGELRTVRV